MYRTYTSDCVIPHINHNEVFRIKLLWPLVKEIHGTHVRYLKKIGNCGIVKEWVMFPRIGTFNDMLTQSAHRHEVPWRP